MTTPKPDEIKALIAKLRDYRIREQPNRFFLDVADALERDHAIVERVTALLEAHELADTVRGDSIATKMLREAIFPPEQRQCSTTPQTGEGE